MEKHLHILIFANAVKDARLIEHHLKKGEFSFTSMVVDTSDLYDNSLDEFKPDVVILDHSLRKDDSLLALQTFFSYRKNYNPAASFVFVTGLESEDIALKMMKEGADDYIFKDRFKRLPAAVLNTVEKNKLRDQRKKEAEEKLYLFDILQRSLHEIYVINPESFKFEYTIHEALKNLGYTPEEMMEMTPADIIKNFDRNRFESAVKRAEENLKGLIIRKTAVRKDGSTYPIQVHLQVIDLGDKKRILANVLDITEEKEKERQNELATFIENSFNYKRDLHESLETILEKLCETCSCIVAEIYSRQFDQPGSKLLASHNTFTPVACASGSSMAETVYDTKKLQIFSLSDEQIKEEDRKRLEAASIKKVVAVPIILGKEIVAVILGFFDQENIDEREFDVLSEQVQNKLAGNIKRKKTEEELQKIFEFSPDILIILGKDGYVRKANPALQRTLGYTPEEMLTKSYDELVHPDDVDVLSEWRATEIKPNEVVHYETRWIDKNGKYRTFSWSVSPYVSGELHFAVGKDITETKKQIQSIQKQNERLAEIAWEQSHVVRAPLTRLLACVEYLEETGSDSDEILASVKNSAYEIDDIIKGIVRKSENNQNYE